MDSLTNILPQDLANIIIDYVDPNKKYLDLVQKNLETIKNLEQDPVFMKIISIKNENEMILKKLGLFQYKFVKNNSRLKLNIQYQNMLNNTKKQPESYDLRYTGGCQSFYANEDISIELHVDPFRGIQHIWFENKFENNSNRSIKVISWSSDGGGYYFTDNIDNIKEEWFCILDIEFS